MWGVMVDYEYSLTSYLKLLNDVLLLEQTIHMQIGSKNFIEFIIWILFPEWSCY